MTGRTPPRPSAYEKLITQDKVDLVLGPYGTPISEAVADVNEKYKMPMVAPVAVSPPSTGRGGGSSSGVLPPAETRLEGFIDLAAKKGFKSVAMINADDLTGRVRPRAPSSWPRRRGFRWSSSTPTRRGTPTSPRS